MLNGTAREMGLGSFPEITLQRARDKAAEARRLKAEGIDPIAERERQRALEIAQAARSVTFRHCAEAYIEAHRDGWKNDKHKAQWKNTLETYAMPTMGALPVSAIDVTLVSAVLEPIWKTKTETARRVRQRIETILDWATTRCYREGENPARWRGHLENLFSSKVGKVEHHSALPYAELPAFMSSVKAQEGLGALALRFTILTAVRTGETIGALWPEIDMDKAVWTVPGSRTKTGRDHRVPLSKPALAILRTQHQATGGKGFVFPGARPKRPLSNMAMLETLRRMKRHDLTVHGFRSTFRDWAEEQTNFPGSVAEAALGHIVGDKTEAAYRRGDLFEKRRKLMAAWAQYATTSADVGKVINLRNRHE
jgi:integrase